MPRLAASVLVAALVAAPGAGAAPRCARVPPGWQPQIAEARDWAKDRRGTVSFAVRTTERLYGWQTRRTVPTASVLKAMLLAAYLRSVHDHDDEIIEVLARREGVDAVADRRPRVLAAVIGALVFLANKDWQASDKESPEDLAAAFDAYADAVIPALAGHWT